jgi:hypothetical protein
MLDVPRGERPTLVVSWQCGITGSGHTVLGRRWQQVCEIKQ